MIWPAAVAMLWTVLPEARIVGGAVRDSLLRQPGADVDMASPLLPDEVLARLRQAGIGAVPTGLQHGTITAVIDGVGYEITTLRRDLTTDGRHAIVGFTDDWRADAARRDFTINAMSMSRDGVIHDYFQGQDDLAAGRVRFVGEPAARIAEDYLRILRFFRFLARFGAGAPDPEAMVAVAAMKPGLRQLSVERVWTEIRQLLAARDPRAAVAAMQATGVLPMLVPEAAVGRFEALVARGAPAEPLLRLAALLPEGDKDFAAAHRLSLAEQDRLRALRLPEVLGPAADAAALRRALADEAADVLVARSWLAQDGRPGWDVLRERIQATPVPVFPLRGRDLLRLGMEPGPEVGGMLAAVRDWWRQGGCVADAGACLDYARRCR